MHPGSFFICRAEIRTTGRFPIAQFEPWVNAVAAADAAEVPRRVFDVMHAEVFAVLTNHLLHIYHPTIFYYQIIVKSTLSFDSK